MLLCALAAAQRVSVTDFQQCDTDESELLRSEATGGVWGVRSPVSRKGKADCSVSSLGLRSAHLDPSGNICAQIRVKTPLKGWTFEAGMAGIEDVRQEQGAVILYVPSYAHTLSFSHPDVGSLRNWSIPQTLQPGCTYSLTLHVGATAAPKRVNTIRVSETRVAVQKTSAAATGATSSSSSQSSQSSRSSVALTASKQLAAASLDGAPARPSNQLTRKKDYCERFVDLYSGYTVSTRGDGAKGLALGLQYCLYEDQAGAYVSLGMAGEESWTAFLGVGARPYFNRTASNFDFQVYGGLGLVDLKNVAAEIGVRAAWKRNHSLSLWDVGVGCQVWRGCVTPTVSLGFAIWGIPVLVSLGVVACGI